MGRKILVKLLRERAFFLEIRGLTLKSVRMTLFRRIPPLAVQEECKPAEKNRIDGHRKISSDRIPIMAKLH